MQGPDTCLRSLLSHSMTFYKTKYGVLGASGDEAKGTILEILTVECSLLGVQKTKNL